MRNVINFSFPFNGLAVTKYLSHSPGIGFALSRDGIKQHVGMGIILDHQDVLAENLREEQPDREYKSGKFEFTGTKVSSAWSAPPWFRVNRTLL